MTEEKVEGGREITDNVFFSILPFFVPYND
jgi:hypothetical protein